MGRHFFNEAGPQRLELDDGKTVERAAEIDLEDLHCAGAQRCVLRWRPPRVQQFAHGAVHIDADREPAPPDRRKDPELQCRRVDLAEPIPAEAACLQQCAGEIGRWPLAADQIRSDGGAIITAGIDREDDRLAAVRQGLDEAPIMGEQIDPQLRRFLPLLQAFDRQPDRELVLPLRDPRSSPGMTPLPGSVPIKLW